eukprot:Ihof_evm8s102 gene=Ihof_evmTU8s102
MNGIRTGIGLAIAKKLLRAAKDNNIALTAVLACRNIQKTEAVKAELLKEYPDAVIELIKLDTSENGSVIKAATAIKERYQRLDYLFLNAGIMPTDGLTLWPLLTTDFNVILDALMTGTPLFKQVDWDLKNGLRAVFGTNLFGHYLLIKCLEDVLISSKARIIWTSSNAASKEFFSLEDIQNCAGSNPYGSSKYAIDLANRGLNDRLNSKGVYSYTCCPGLVITQISLALLPYWAWMVLVYPFLWLIRLINCGFFTYFPDNGAHGLAFLSGMAGTESKVINDGKEKLYMCDKALNPFIKYN